jgi:hypothetical protein
MIKNAAINAITLKQFKDMVNIFKVWKSMILILKSNNGIINVKNEMICAPCIRILMNFSVFLFPNIANDKAI